MISQACCVRPAIGRAMLGATLPYLLEFEPA